MLIMIAIFWHYYYSDCGSNSHYAFVYFVQLASSSLLRLGQETDKELVKNRDSVYLLLDQVIFFSYSFYVI